MSRFGKVGLLASVALVLGVSQSAFGQQEMKLRSEGLRPYTIELKPIPTALSAAPSQGAAGSIGLGAEAFLGDKAAWFVDGNYVNVNLPNKAISRESDANPNQPVVDKQIGYELLTGLRMYSSPVASSWYGELGVGYADTSGRFKYEDNYVSSHVISVLPTAEVGYRWLFGNNILLRLGAGTQNNQVMTRSSHAQVAGTNATTAEQKVTNLQKTPWLAAVDLGLGYAF